MTTPVTAKTYAAARPGDTLLSPRTADCACRPTSTNSALLSTVVANVQNAVVCCRAAAPVIRGASWLISNPHTTTARTPDACISSASRNAANGVTSTAMFSSIGSSIRRRTCQLSNPTRPPASTPPP